MHFKEVLWAPFLYIIDPTKRIFFIYILSSFLLALFVLLKQKNSFQQSLNKIFDLRVWNHKSSRLDVSLWLFNMCLRSFLFFMITFSSIGFARILLKNLYNLFPHFKSFSIELGLVVLLYSITSFVFLDLSRFLFHYLLHKSSYLWKFHKIHHSAEVLTPLTLYRTHPVESVLSSLIRIFVLGLISGVFMFLFRSKIDAYAILGVNAFDFIFNFLGSNLRHSHVWLSFGPINHIIVSPAQHQIHHSRILKHRDKNLGFTFSVWDKIFGTFYQVSWDKEFLILGVRGEKSKNLLDSLRSPFIK